MLDNVSVGEFLMTKFINSGKYDITKYDKSKWEEYDRLEFAWFAQNAKESFNKISAAFFDGDENKTLHEIVRKAETIGYDIDKIDSAKLVLEDWKLFKDNLDTNPHVKEQWEGLLLAVKLMNDDN